MMLAVQDAQQVPTGQVTSPLALSLKLKQLLVHPLGASFTNHAHVRDMQHYIDVSPCETLFSVVQLKCA